MKINQALAVNEKITGKVALKGFFKITDEWNLTPSNQKILLGDIPNSTYSKYKKLPDVKLPHDMLERISYILGIYKALRILFPTLQQANEWVKKDNAAMPFKSSI